MNEREQRGLTIAALSKLTKKGGVWLVPSQSGQGKYTVCPDGDTPHCTCPDHETRGVRCKHIYAVEFAIKREMGSDGSVVETRSITLTETRKSYPQNWPAYNAAQVNEKATFLALLRDLCAGIPDRQENRPGRPSFPIRDAIFAACFKVYSTLSGRRFMTDLRDAHAKGYNLYAIEAIGAAALIPFKKNATAAKGGLWAKMLHYFSFNRDEFLARYHRRSNVESTFSMVKAKFRDGVRSKCDVAMKNEVLAKLVCHNICCVISAMHELGVDPTFWSGTPE